MGNIIEFSQYRFNDKNSRFPLKAIGFAWLSFSDNL